MRRLPTLALFALLLSACQSDAQPAPPASSAELAERMRARFEENVGGAGGFTVWAGGYVVRYTVRPDSVAPERRIDVAIAATDSVDADPMVQGVVGSHVANVPLLAAGIADQPLGAPIERDGHRVYAIEAGDAVGAADTTGAEARLRVYVDAETFDVREVYRSVRPDSLGRPVTLRLLYDDFRTADGVTLPWRIDMRQDGLDQLIAGSMRMVQGGQLTMGRAQLRAQPPSPERDAQLAEVERQLRLVTEGVQEARVEVRRVAVEARRER